MPMTPAEALGKCVNAALNEDERTSLEETIAFIDKIMTDNWNGAALIVRIPACTQKVLGRVMRAYALKSWLVAQAQPIDGAFGTAQQLLASGAPVIWQITLAPDWRPFGTPSN